MWLEGSNGNFYTVISSLQCAWETLCIDLLLNADQTYLTLTFMHTLPLVLSHLEPLHAFASHCLPPLFDPFSLTWMPCSDTHLVDKMPFFTILPALIPASHPKLLILQ